MLIIPNFIYKVKKKVQIYANRKKTEQRILKQTISIKHKTTQSLSHNAKVAKSNE